MEALHSQSSVPACLVKVRITGLYEQQIRFAEIVRIMQGSAFQVACQD